MSGSSSYEDDGESLSRLHDRQLDELDQELPNFWSEHNPDGDSLQEIPVHNFLEKKNRNAVDSFVPAGLTTASRPEWSRHLAAVTAQVGVNASRVDALDEINKRFAELETRFDEVKTQHASVSKSVDRYKGTCTEKVLDDTVSGIETFIKRHPAVLPALMNKLSSPIVEHVSGTKELRQEMDTLASDVAQLQAAQAEQTSVLRDTRQSVLKDQSTVKGLEKETRSLISSHEDEYTGRAEAQKELDSLRSEIETARREKNDAERQLVDREYRLTSQVNGLTTSLGKSQGSLKDAKSEIEGLEKDLRKVRDELDDCKADHGTTQRLKEITELELGHTRASLENVQNELQTIRTERDDLNGRVIRNNSLIQQYAGEQATARRTIANLQTEVANVRASCERAKGFNVHYEQSIADIKKQNVILSNRNGENEAQVMSTLHKYNMQATELRSKVHELEEMADKVKSLEVENARLRSGADVARTQWSTEREALQAESSSRQARIHEVEQALAKSEQGLIQAEATIQDITAVLDPEGSGRTPLQLAQSQCGLVGDLQQWKSGIEESRVDFYQNIIDAIFTGTVVHERSTLRKLESDYAETSQLGQDLQHGDICLNVENFQTVHGIPPASQAGRRAWEQALILLGQIHSDDYEVSVGDVEAIGLGLRSSDYDATRMTIILLFRFVRLRYDRLESSDGCWSYPTSLVVLRAMEILASHTTGGAALWLMSKLFEDIRRRLPLEKLLVKLLVESVRCRLEKTSSSMREMVEEAMAEKFLPAGDYLIGLADENLVLISHEGEVAIVSPDQFMVHLDAIEGCCVTFTGAPLVGSWQAPYWAHDVYLPDFEGIIRQGEIEGNSRFSELWIDRVW